MATKKKKTVKKVRRSAKSGKFVSEKYAKSHPNTTVTESSAITITMSAKKKK